MPTIQILIPNLVNSDITNLKPIPTIQKIPSLDILKPMPTLQIIFDLVNLNHWLQLFIQIIPKLVILRPMPRY